MTVKLKEKLNNNTATQRGREEQRHAERVRQQPRVTLQNGLGVQTRQQQLWQLRRLMLFMTA